jgi:hypothetical protein
LNALAAIGYSPGVRPGYRRLLIACAAAATLVACGKPGTTFESPDGSFSARFPVSPASIRSPQGSYAFTTIDQGVTYTATAKIVYPLYREMSTTEALFDEAQKALTGYPIPPVVSRERIELRPQGYPGREIVFRRDDGMLIKSRIYRVEQTMIFLTILAPSDRVDSAPVRTFLDSLVVRKAPEIR